MAWVTLPNRSPFRLSRWLPSVWVERDDEESVYTVAVDGFHELRAVADRWNVSYYDHDRTDPLNDIFVRRGGGEGAAIAEWRRMLREGEI